MLFHVMFVVMLVDTGRDVTEKFFGERERGLVEYDEEDRHPIVLKQQKIGDGHLGPGHPLPAGVEGMPDYPLHVKPKTTGKILNLWQRQFFHVFCRIRRVQDQNQLNHCHNALNPR